MISSTGKLGKSCYPTNLRVTNPSLLSARAWVATPPCPSSPPLRLPTSATGWREREQIFCRRRVAYSGQCHCIGAATLSIKQPGLEPDFDPPRPKTARSPTAGMASGPLPMPRKRARWTILAMHTITGYLKVTYSVSNAPPAERNRPVAAIPVSYTREYGSRVRSVFSTVSNARRRLRSEASCRRRELTPPHALAAAGPRPRCQSS